MKQIVLILTLTYSFLAQCQSDNIITLTEFNSIEISGHKLIDIANTQGDQKAIESMFGEASEVTIDPDDEFSHYEYNGFSIGFSNIWNGSVNQTEISSFYITDNNYKITIQGTTVTIGDNINLLGNVVFNTMNNGNQSIVFMYCDGCNSFISIRFNQSTKAITKIIYIEQT